MEGAVDFAHYIQYVCNVTVPRASNKVLLFLPTFSSLMGTTDDNIDKFITPVHCDNSGRVLYQRISIPVGVIIHLKAQRFELDDRNK